MEDSKWKEGRGQRGTALWLVELAMLVGKNVKESYSYRLAYSYNYIGTD